MAISFRFCAPILLAAALTTPAMTGCAVHARVYDPYDHNYHAWASERGHYEQWEQQNHMQHQDYNKRSADQQKQYWDWRHNQDQH